MKYWRGEKEIQLYIANVGAHLVGFICFFLLKLVSYKYLFASFSTTGKSPFIFDADKY